MQSTPEPLVHVFHEEKQIGPYSLAAVREMLSAGGLSSAAMAWREGMADWQPIEQFLAAHPAPAVIPVSSGAVRPAVRSGPDYAAIAAASGKTKSEPSSLSRLIRSVIAGGVAALIGGAVWVAIAVGVGIQLGWLAWGIGAFCGWSVSRFGRGTGGLFQVIAVACSLLGIAIGKVGILLSGYVPVGFLDILWIILAVASAWKTAGGGD
jgi:hypothetical protein